MIVKINKIYIYKKKRDMDIEKFDNKLGKVS